MNDCIWHSIGICRKECGCNCSSYISMNSPDGAEMFDEWYARVQQVIVPLAEEFAKEKGWVRNES